MRDEVLRRLALLRRRHSRVRATDLFLETAFALTAGVAVLLLLDRFAFEFGLARPHLASPGAIALLFAGALAVAAVVALAAGALAASSPGTVASKADRVLALDERLLTSLELAEAPKPSPFAVPIFEQAAASLRSADPRTVFPGSPVGYRWGILLALAAGVLLAGFAPHLHPPPHAGFTFSPEQGPAPLTVIFEEACQGAIDSFEWDFGDGRSASGRVAVHRYDAPGTYAVRLFIRGPGGEASHAASVQVGEPGLPLADFEVEPSRGPAPLAVRFSSRSQRASRLSWAFGDGAFSQEPHPEHRYETPGLYEATLTARNDRGAAVKTRTIKVLGPGAPMADFRAMPRRGPSPLVVTFEDNSTGAITEWEWDVGDPYAGDGRVRREWQPSHVYRVPGRYTVRLKVKGPGGEDEIVRVRYIEVEGNGDGGGGGAGGTGRSSGGGGSGSGAGGGGTGDQEGQLFGALDERPKVELTPEMVQGQPRGEELVEKVKNVYGKGGGSGSPGRERPYTEAFGEYRRAAEDAMNRERIPPPLRDYLKRYFEEIRPK